MTGSHGEALKLYADPSGAVVIECPRCKAVKEVPADKFRGAKPVLKVRCRCNHPFRIEPVFRKFYRKPTSLSGTYLLLPERIHRGRILVVNISQGGVGLRIIGPHRLRPGQELLIVFHLDDRRQSGLERRVAVRLVDQNYIGCEFLDDITHDKTLGFYLMV